MHPEPHTESKFPWIASLSSRMRVDHRILSHLIGESADSKRQALLRVLSIAHSQRLDPAVLVGNLAKEYRGRYRRQLLRLSDRLSAGTPAAAALEQTPGTISQSDVLALQFAHQTGVTTQVFDRLLEQQPDRRSLKRARSRLRESLGYTIGMSICILLVAVFLFLFIIPMLRHLCADFHMQEPSGLRSLIAFGDGIAQYGPTILLGVVVVIAVFWVGNARGWFKIAFSTRLQGTHGYSRSADLLRLLSISTQSGRPITAALSSLARFHFDDRSRQKLLLARNEAELGVDVWQSLADSELISSDEAAGLTNLPDRQVKSWAMWQLADIKQDQIGRRRERLFWLIPPIATLSLAAFVAWLGFATLQFLYALVYYAA